jgi:hypothetical protein
MRSGEFGVIEAGDGFAVVQFDQLGPILRLGPFASVRTANRECERLVREGWVEEAVLVLECQL